MRLNPRKQNAKGSHSFIWHRIFLIILRYPILLLLFLSTQLILGNDQCALPPGNTIIQEGFFTIRTADCTDPDALRERLPPEISILEPIPPSGHVLWVPAEAQLPQNMLLNSIEILSGQSKISTQLKNLTGNIPAIAFWYHPELTADGAEKLVTQLNGKVVQFGRVQLSDQISYGLCIAKISFAGVIDLAANPEVRWIYPSPEVPGLDDELAVREVSYSPFRGAYMPGYRQQLEQWGLSGLGERIGVIDTGFDTNSNETCHPDLRGRLAAFIKYGGSPHVDYVGHGTHIGGILSGNGMGDGMDSDGFLYGLGVAPNSELVVSEALLALPFPPDGGLAKMFFDVAAAPAELCNNSWNDREGVGIGYTANCAILDAAVRNAAAGFLDDKILPLTLVFSIGNTGPSYHSVSSPKEAKNIITVGACGSVRGGQTDEILEFSSRGPCLDGRSAPTLVAPGLDIFSCWPGDVYKAQSGTSAATALVTGFAALIRENCNKIDGEYPSPALLKAFVAGFAAPMSETLPDPASGWGKLDAKDLPYRLRSADWVDQAVVLDWSGDEFTCQVSPLDASKPLDIFLVWTDAPAAPESFPALVNDLDLIVSKDDVVYSGNNLQNGFSANGRNLDHTNNTELIRIENPEPLYDLSVIADSIAGDGVPGNEMMGDQDFALLVINGAVLTDDVRIKLSEHTAACNGSVQCRVSGKSLVFEEDISVDVNTDLSENRINLPLRKRPGSDGIFEGTIFTTNTASERPGSIRVEHLDTVSVFYDSPASESASDVFFVDCEAPGLQSLDITRITADSADFVWNTHEMSRTVFRYRIHQSFPWEEWHETDYLTDHHLTLSHLEPETVYDYYLILYDTLGNYSNQIEETSRGLFITDRRSYVYTADMDLDPAWPVMTGQWSWGVPTGQGTPPDPVAGYTGENVIGYNLNGNYANNLPEETAESPVIDCSIVGDYQLTFQGWLSSEYYLLDEASVEVKKSDGQWNRIWRNPLLELTGGWNAFHFDITDAACGNSQFQFRFIQGPTDFLGARSGWNIDDISLSVDITLPSPTPRPTPSTSEPFLSLELNQELFRPGDQMTLLAEYALPSSFCDKIALGIVVVVEQFYLFYPDWNEHASFEILNEPLPNSAVIVALDFTWPEYWIEPLELQIIGVLFNPDSLNTWSNVATLNTHFNPS